MHPNIIEMINDGYFEVDLAGNFTFFNASVCRVLGYSREELMGMNYRNYTDTINAKKVFQAYHQVYATESPITAFNWQVKSRDGSKRHIEGSISLLKDSSGNKTGFLGIVNDVSKRIEMEEKLRFEEKRFRNLVEHASDIIVVVNPEGLIIYENPAVEKVLGYHPEERIGRQGLEIVHPDDAHFLVSSFIALIGDAGTPPIRGEVRLRHKNGTYRTLEVVQSNLVKDDAVEAVILNYRDITERKIAEEALKKSEQRYLELSIMDDLTQLYNSRHFYMQLQKEIERSKRYEQPLTLLFLDLDKFKDFNDTFGHIEGDHVLARLGLVIKRCLRDSDSAYRYGGEEFTVMLPMTTSKEGFVTAERIKDELSREVFTPGPDREIFLTMSVGVAQYQLDEEMKTFVNRADQFMYRAKNEGRNRICCEA